MTDKPIRMYEDWIKESEQVDPTTPPPAQEQSAPPTDTPPTDVPPTDQPPTTETEPTEMSEADRFEEIDSKRKEAIKAFKEKQKEFMAIPIETRKNPMNDEDRQKVDSLKSELTTLNQAMKDAVAEYDKFNDEMLGTGGDETDIEP